MTKRNFTMLGFIGFLAVAIPFMLHESEAPQAEPAPRNWRNYTVNKIDVYEWRDGFGRVCTFTKLFGGREQALDCDWPQTPSVE
jgi:hypothetical protein